MPNEKNLMPIEEVNSRRSREEHSEDSRKGGIASGVSRRRKKSLREAADHYLSLRVVDEETLDAIKRDGLDPDDIDNQMAMVAGLTKAAIMGDSKAAKVIIDLLGEDSKSDAGEGVQIIDDL